jgi:AdoMet-dependent heme synthase
VRGEVRAGPGGGAGAPGVQAVVPQRKAIQSRPDVPSHTLQPSGHPMSSTTFLMDSKAFQLLQRNAAAKSIPLSVLFEVTHACNYDCVHCYNPSVKRGTPVLSLQEYKALFEKLREMGTFLLTFSGGEPFVRRDFISIVNMAADMRFSYRIFTNGSMLNEERLARLNKSGLSGFELSLYGASPEVCDPIMGKKGAFNEIVSAVKLLRRHNIPVLLKATVLKQNFKDLIKMWELGQELGAEFKYSPWVTLAEESGMRNLDYRMTPAQLDEYYTLLAQLNQRMGGADGENGAKAGPVTEAASCESWQDEYLCGAGTVSCQIDPYGEVFPCVEIWESGGNIRQSPFETIWRNGEVFNTLRGLRKRDVEWVEDGCGDGGCSFHCAGISKNETGSYTGANPIAKKLAPYEKRLKEGYYTPQFDFSPAARSGKERPPAAAGDPT